tara:strand:+ start:158 stop:400 length:243 start_codon:yes stop_codon:yes gene_type:complete
LGLIVKNGQVAANLSKRDGKLKGLISKNGQITQSLRSLPADIVVTEDSALGILAIMGIDKDDVSAILGIAKASIGKVMGN